MKNFIPLLNKKVIYERKIGEIIVVRDTNFVARFGETCIEFLNDGRRWSWDYEPSCFELANNKSTAIMQ